MAAALKDHPIFLCVFSHMDGWFSVHRFAIEINHPFFACAKVSPSRYKSEPIIIITMTFV